MRPYSLHSIATCLLFASLTACANHVSSTGSASTDSGPRLDTASQPRTPLASLPAGDLAAAVTSNNTFGLGLYQQLAPGAQGGNYLTSPVSASLALTMAYAGAANQTATEMASALHLASSGSPFDDQNALSQTLAGRAAAAFAYDQTQSGTSSSVSQDNYVVDVVNSVWGQKGSPWSAPFLGILATSYGTGIYTEDFASDPSAALTDINDWVSTQTAGQIDPLLGPSAVDASTRMVLVNAVNLKLPWDGSPFQTELTQPGPFTRGDGSQVTANMMHGSEEGGYFGYTDTSAATFVSLPLAGNHVSLVLALPKTNLASLVSSLTAASWASAWSALQQGNDGVLSVTLPKFTFATNGFSLANALQSMGMHQAFDPQNADFSAMCSSCSGLYISDVVQKATIGVDEIGVQAAAATAVFIAGGGPQTPIVATFDHPFLVSIVDASGAILFLGQVNDPTDTGSP